MLQALFTALSFLIKLIFDLYILLLLLRLLFQKLGAHWFNPISQFVIRYTEPVIKPTRRFIPGFKGFDLAIVLLAIILEMIKTWLLGLLQSGIWLKFFGVLIISLGNLFIKVSNIYFYAFIIGAIMSWLPILQHNPLAEIIRLLTNPILIRLRRFIQPISGIDFTPLIAIVFLFLLDIVIFNQIVAWGAQLAVK